MEATEEDKLVNQVNKYLEVLQTMDGMAVHNPVTGRIGDSPIYHYVLMFRLVFSDCPIPRCSPRSDNPTALYILE